MTRWWADPAQSRVVLGLVDSSDVEQGVGTALLAYHGIATQALEPLGKRTLVDVASIRTALDQIDLEPVAKALGRATKPIMGEASDRYGQIMASDMHRQAVEATERLLLRLTSTGMAWPTAIERVTDVHGVPTERLGKAAAAFTTPSLPPLVRADVGDRALMEYAAHLGYREAGAVVEIGKAAQEEEFDPSDHPRGANGRFVNAPDRMEPVMDRQARMDRFRRKRGAQQRQQANPRRVAAAEAPKESSLLSLVSAIREHVNTAEEKQAPAQAKAGNSRRERMKLVRGKKAGEDDLTKPVAATGLEYRLAGERFALVPTDLAQKLSSLPEFSVGRLEEAMGDRLEWMDYEAVTEHVKDVYQGSSLPSEALGYTVLYIDGDIPVNNGSRHDPSVYMAGSAQLERIDRTAPSGFGDIEQRHEFEDLSVDLPPNSMHPNPAFAARGQRKQLQIMRVQAANAFDYPAIHEQAKSKKYGNPMAYDYDDDSRASKAFEENEVRRDSRGRFADEPDRMEPDTARVARMDRFRRKKQGRANRAKRPAAQAPAPRLSAQDMAVLRDMIEQDTAAEDVLVAPRPRARAKPTRLERKKALQKRLATAKTSEAAGEGMDAAEGLQGMKGVLVEREDYDIVMGRGSDRGAGEKDAGSADMFDSSIRAQALDRIRTQYQNTPSALGVVKQVSNNRHASDTHKLESSPQASKASALQAGKELYARSQDLANGEISEADFRSPDAFEDAYGLMAAQDFNPSPPIFGAAPYETKDGKVVWEPTVQFGVGVEDDKVLIVGFDSDFEKLLGDQLPEVAVQPIEATARELLDASDDQTVTQRNPLLRVIPLDYGHTERKD